MESIYSTFFQVPTSVTNVGNILYAAHVEVFACFPALPAASPVLSALSLQAVFRAQFTWIVVTWLFFSDKYNIASQLHWRAHNLMYFTEFGYRKLFIFGIFLNETWNKVILMKYH